jgi:cilia- and flagella-associated protein 57
VFEKQSKAMKGLEEDVEKREKKIKELDKMKDIEKAKTKEKERTVQRFVNDVHKIVQQNKSDEREYIKGLMRIYEDYVKAYSEEILEKKKKDPETIEELDRQLKYMEKSITALRSTTVKAEVSTRGNIKKRTLENTDLIKQLNELRATKKNCESDLESETLKLQKLALDKTKLSRDI